MFRIISREGGTIAAYLVTLALVLVGAAFPQGRVWSVSIWPLLGPAAPYLAVSAGLILLIILLLVAGGERNPEESESTSRWLWPALTVTLLFAVLFVLLRARTHFLGDGYSLLANLAAAHPLIKLRNLGEEVLHLWVREATGAVGDGGALVSYQIVSFACGIGFVILTAITAHALFERRVERLLFLLGLTTAGYMPLFFGYVENYSAFVFSVGMFTLLGVLIVRQKVGRWLIIPMLLISVLLHVFGVLLAPAALFAVFVDRKRFRRLTAVSTRTKWLFVFLTFFVGLGIYLWLRSHFLFVRFAVLPLVKDAFTVDGYTLLSLSHVIDIANLLFLLVPGLIIAVVMLFRDQARSFLTTPEYRFVLLVTAPCLFAVFVFDPKLGMARDWDLMSFAGIGLAVLAYLTVLRSRASLAARTTAAGGMIVLSLVSLVPRLAAQTNEKIALNRFEELVRLDHSRNRNAFSQLIDYYLQTGRPALAEQTRHRFDRIYPEWGRLKQISALMRAGRLTDAVRAGRNLTARHPELWPAWEALGRCYSLLGQDEQAVTSLGIAAGLNPHGATIFGNLGVARLHLGQLKEAERDFRRAYDLDEHLSLAIIGLWQTSFRQGKYDAAFAYAQQLSDSPTAQPEDFSRIGAAFQKAGMMGMANDIRQRGEKYKARQRTR